MNQLPEIYSEIKVKYNGVLLGIITLVVLVITPPWWNWQPAPLAALMIAWGLGTLVYQVGLVKRLLIWKLAGAFSLLTLIGAGLLTPPGNVGVSQEKIIVPRLIIWLVITVGWLNFTALPTWLWWGVLAVMVPTIATLLLVWQLELKVPLDFIPYWPAITAHGQIIISDEESPIIRIFSPDGNLQAKLRPSASYIPGSNAKDPGFLAVGPSVDPEHLGISPVPYNILDQDEVQICGMASDHQGDFYLVDNRRKNVLVFDDTTGLMLFRWPLPRQFNGSRGCVSVDDRYIYLGDLSANGQVIVLNLKDGQIADNWVMPDMPGGVSTDGEGRLFALSLPNKVCSFEREKGSSSRNCWPLPPVTGELAQPFEALAVTSNRIYVTDLANSQVLIFTPTGIPLGSQGGCGAELGRLCAPAGLAVDRNGNLLVADFSNRVVQRFVPPEWKVNGLWRAIQDEID